MKKIGVVLIDDHPIVRQGFRSLLERQDDIEVMGEAEDGHEALKMVKNLSPTVVFVDITMPQMNGIETTRQIVLERPGTRVLALTMHALLPMVRAMLEAGASGYLLKSCTFKEILQAIHTVVHQNQMYLCPEISKLVLGEYLRPSEQRDMPDILALTAGEKEILQLIAEGKTSRQIGGFLCISPRTVEKHRLHIMKKLDVHSVAGLVKYAIRQGLSDI